jgi:hypothetical protein
MPSWNTTVARERRITLATKHAPHTRRKRRGSARLLRGIIVITPPRARDTDFTKETTTKRDSSKWPHEVHFAMCQTDDPSHPSHRRLVALILKRSSEEEMCRTRVDEVLRHRATTQCRSSSSLAAQGSSSNFTTEGDQHEDKSDTPQQEADQQNLPATKPSLVTVVVVAQATTRHPTQPKPTTGPSL